MNLRFCWSHREDLVVRLMSGVSSATGFGRSGWGDSDSTTFSEVLEHLVLLALLAI